MEELKPLSVMDDQHKGRCLLDYMRSKGLDGYGTVISAIDVRAVVGIEYPETASLKEYQSLGLLELGAVGYVRNILLDEGKYLCQVKDNYRVLLPSENASQVDAYMRQADNKLRRARRLSASSPPVEFENSNVNARLHMKLQSMRPREA